MSAKPEMDSPALPKSTVEDAPRLPTTGLPPRDKVAANLLYGTLSVLLLLTIGLVIYGFVIKPPGLDDLHVAAEAALGRCLASGCASNQVEVAQKLLNDTAVIDHYHEWWERIFERATNVLVPLVTALFGYIFGTQNRRDSESDSEN